MGQPYALDALFDQVIAWSQALPPLGNVGVGAGSGRDHDLRAANGRESLAADRAGADDEVTVRHDWSACARSSA
ncbi:MAG: hypothetical protein QOI06_2356 [Nocardioidaceae bacterium]|jgi:hypothetical protein|nr:hypothetical protein [Nocardioidaceae bacterium]